MVGTSETELDDIIKLFHMLMILFRPPWRPPTQRIEELFYYVHRSRYIIILLTVKWVEIPLNGLSITT